MSLTPAGSESSISGLLTCITCRVGFKEGDLQREHYKSDWHRYNLKRKIVSLPPVTRDNFNERLALQEQQEREANKETKQYCSTCKKTFGNEKAFSTHVLSKKHNKEVEIQVMGEGQVGKEVKKDKCVVGSPPKVLTQSPQIPSKFPGKGQQLMEVDDDDDDDDSWEEIEGTPIPSSTCLFCSFESGDVEANLEHMSVNHSFFIPDMEYCTDIEGLLDYLGTKVGEGMMCLWCNEKGKSFYDVQAVQQHMRDKGHCKILHEADAAFEYSDYYDYTPSYPQDCVAAPDEPYQPEQLRYNEHMQLVLPSGMALGHRALKLYYRQYVRPGSRSLVEIKRAKRTKILSQYKAIGYTGSDPQAAQLKLRDQRYFKLIKDKYNVKLGMKGNKTLQNHFRAQVMF